MKDLLEKLNPQLMKFDVRCGSYVEYLLAL